MYRKASVTFDEKILAARRSRIFVTMMLCCESQEETCNIFVCKAHELNFDPAAASGSGRPTLSGTGETY